MPAIEDRANPTSAGPAIILVEPQLGENIGMVARAMANFGLSELRLVNPRDGWPSEKARAAASRADHVIDATRVFDDLASAVADLNFVFATTARERDGFKPVRGPVEAGRALRARVEAGQRTGILFGRERFGLYNENALEARGYFRPEEKKPKMVDNLRAVLTRAGFAEPELKVLRGIISSLDRFSPAMPRGDGSPGDDPRRLPAAARSRAKDEES
ncbi:MAG: RNA methyltransferase [Mesorhizobium sp.]|nr:MAG: RNA methyltransferase [Mesorhizobium sp.]